MNVSEGEEGEMEEMELDPIPTVEKPEVNLDVEFGNELSNLVYNPETKKLMRRIERMDPTTRRITVIVSTFYVALELYIVFYRFLCILVL